MKNRFIFFLVPILFFLVFSCKKTDIIPAYLVLSSEEFENCVDVSNLKKEDGTNYEQEELKVIKQQTIKDVLVRLNGTNLGYWQVPCTIPLLPDYSIRNNISLIPCVRVPNTNLTTVPYYFLGQLTQFFDMEKEEVYKFSDIKFEYVQSVAFPVLETFVSGTSFVPLDSNFKSTIIISDTEPVGCITLGKTDKFFMVGTKDFLDLKGQGARQFWEICYKSENGEMTAFLNFDRTVQGVTHEDIVVLPPSKGAWKTAYIDITNIVQKASNIAPKVLVRLGLRGLKEDESVDANFYFGYMKLITMNAPY